ncbi:MAG TPA: TadE family protein [Acetobacteraceae bacterium]|nr:TadE family protein [Acetobacteraceae bacterium]
MNALLRWCGCAGRGVAAIEFAITLPILLLFLGGVTDFGIVYYRQISLSSAVAAGAEYAMLADQRGQTLTQATMQTVMQNAAAQTLPGGTVTATATNPAVCYCMTGSSPSSVLTAVTCGSYCASGAAAAKYVQLSLAYNYDAILPIYSQLAATTTLTASTWVPLQ